MGDKTNSSTLEMRARAGDPVATARLFDACRPELVRFCIRYLGNAHAAEDAVQDVMAAILQREAWPRQGTRPFLFRLARNRCIDLCRRPGGRGLATFRSEALLLSPRTGPGTAAVRAEDRESVRRHLGALAFAQAEVLVLRYFEGLGRREIADVLDVPESTVRSRLREGLKSLHEQMRREKR